MNQPGPVQIALTVAWLMVGLVVAVARMSRGRQYRTRLAICATVVFWPAVLIADRYLR